MRGRPTSRWSSRQSSTGPGHKPQACQRDRPDDPAIDPRPRRRGHRITSSFRTEWPFFFPPKRPNQSGAIGRHCCQCRRASHSGRRAAGCPRVQRTARWGWLAVLAWLRGCAVFDDYRCRGRPKAILPAATTQNSRKCLTGRDQAIAAPTKLELQPDRLAADDSGADWERCR